jgi:glycosyltransferase involved in cell wall biosynthesis
MIVGDDSIGKAVAHFKPDLVHFHWLSTPWWPYLDELRRHDFDVPVTIRGHSFDFDLPTARELLRLPCVKRLWLFPHYASLVSDPKVVPLTACYDPEIYFPDGGGVMPRQVLRVGAGMPSKGLEGFVEVAKLCPTRKFVLVVTRSFPPDDWFADHLVHVRPENLEVHVNLQREEVLALMLKSSLLVTGHGVHNQFSMPVAIAEAMACGLTIMAPNVPAARLYAGNAGVFYDDEETLRGSFEGQTSLVEKVLSWDDHKWVVAYRRSLELAPRYSADRVLPEIRDFWLGLNCSS